MTRCAGFRVRRGKIHVKQGIMSQRANADVYILERQASLKRNGSLSFPNGECLLFAVKGPTEVW